MDIKARLYGCKLFSVLYIKISPFTYNRPAVIRITGSDRLRKSMISWIKWIIRKI
jgi:hypothetical protein